MGRIEQNDLEKPPAKQCHCISIILDKGKAAVTHNIPTKESSPVGIIDFGEVLPGSHTVRYIDLKNTLDQPVTYYIHRESFVNDIYQSFHFNKYNVKINPCSTSKLKITYYPLLENEKSSDLFKIAARDSPKLENLRLVGKCLGTIVKCSTKNIYFIITPTKKKRSSTFELKNISSVPATFQFDVNENEDPFTLNIENGQIPPKKSIYITVTFNGKTEGIFYKRLVALLYRHEPIMIDLLGEYNRGNESRVNDAVMYPNDSQSTYSAYFNDYGFLDEKVLPFKLNKKDIDFGRILPETLLDSSQNKNIAVATLKNNMQNEISIKWYEDPLNIFFIQPNKLNVGADETGYFELSFKPNFRDHMYHRKMAAQIFWKDSSRPNTPMNDSLEIREVAEYVPLEATLTMIGHSFPENQSWISAVESIPNKIIFPVCLPGHTSFTTFMLKTDGHLPVLFKLIPPKNSVIRVKPMMGLIRFSKLFVAKLEAESVPTVYKEEWIIEINGEAKRTLRIIFLGQSEVPSIMIGTNNSIKFNPTLPECQDIIHVTVKNTSCYHLRLYLMDKKNQYFHVQPSTAELYPNEEIDTLWTFNAKHNVPQKTEIQCIMRVISNNDEVIGLPFETHVFVETCCEYSQICATPRHINFGNIPWEEKKDVEFKIFNFGKSTVFYTLKALTLSGTQNEIIIPNAIGKLQPYENKTISLTFIAKTLGTQIVNIIYYTRINEFELVETVNHPVDLFCFKCKCINSTVQIEECVEHDMGRTFSKLDMWNFFEVNTINEELNEVIEGETRIVKVLLPTVPCHNKEYNIRFVLRNITNFDLTASLTRVKMCNCQVTEISKSISFRQKVLNCPHRGLLKMELSDENIHARSFQYLDIFMNFNLISNEEIAYNMRLDKDRNIQFHFKMNIIPSNVKTLSLYNTEKRKIFLNMFIGAREPPYQTVWLYNPTSQETFYQLLDDELHVWNKKEGFPVISCLNNKGFVSPFSSKAILLRFHPIEAKKYQITLPLILGNEKINLKLIGMGIYKYDHDLIHNLTNTMPKISLQHGKFPISLSADYIAVEAFSVWNTTEKLIYMKNTTKDRVIEYTWNRCFMEGIIEINADKANGLLQPDELVEILLKFQSFHIPAITTINMFCKIFDVTQHEIHEKLVKEYEERQALIDNYFMIDETGTHKVKNEIEIKPLFEEQYITLAITFHTISTLELSHYLDVEKFFGQNPLECFEPEVDMSSHIKLEADVECKESNSENNQFVLQILEGFIMDTLRCPVFQELMETQREAAPPYYIQFKQDKEKNKLKEKNTNTMETERDNGQFTAKDLSNAFKSMIKDTVQQIFF